jgi:hypothetical protein
MHDPLTVVHAVDGCACGRTSVPHVPTARARVVLGPDGRADLLATAAGEATARAHATRPTCAYAAWFWGCGSHAEPGGGSSGSNAEDAPPGQALLAAVLPPGDAGNCQVTVGPLTPDEVAAVVGRLRDMLVPSEAGGPLPVASAELASAPFDRPKGLSKDLWATKKGSGTEAAPFPGELELELIQTQMAQMPMLRSEVHAQVLCASQKVKRS